MRRRSTGRFVSVLLAVSLLCLSWLATAVAQEPLGLKACTVGTTECPDAPCSIMCKMDSRCLQCGCTHVCSPLSDVLQRPLHMCTDDGTLAQTCDILDSIKPGTTCAKAAACEPGFVCREYLCSKGCLAKCVPDGTKPPPIIPPAWPPADWSYYCLDGTPAQKCDNPVQNIQNSCQQLGCGAGQSPVNAPVKQQQLRLPQQQLICGNFKCGTDDSAVCQTTCVKDTSFGMPPPLPAGPFCPDNVTIADRCSSGATQEDVDKQCWDLACEDDRVMCGEFRCRDDRKCDVTCVTGAYHQPYRCPVSGRAGRMCNPPPELPPVCDPPCNTPAENCLPLYCGDGCKYQCIKDPWYVAPTFICPETLQYVPECKPVAADAGACSTKDCNRGGRMCRFLNCGSGCKAYCTTDLNYIAPQPSPFLCPADNSTALQCFSTDGAAACNVYRSDGSPPEVSCKDGTLCGEFKCGTDDCKAMCVVDPWYRPYICPATGTVAQSCNLKPVEQNYDCTEDCTSIGPQYFCGIFNCSGTCAPTCIADPWYEPPTYICGDTGVIAKECKVQNPTLTCKTMKCAPGHVCGPYDCTANLSDGGTNGGGSTRPGSTGGTGRRQLAGNAAILQEDSCRYRCVKDPYWTPPPVYRCQSNGEIATECGFLADKPLQRTGRSVSNRRQGVTNKPSRDMMWQPCDPECTEPGYFCMTATCGSDGTCGPTCVKDDNWVPPPPPPTLCADSFNSARLCASDTPIDDVTCEALGCREQGYTCANADCGDGSGCSPRCITQGWFFPGVPTTPITYSCPGDDKTKIAEPCVFKPLLGQATCEDGIKCDPGMMCGNYKCDGVCGPMCVPMPPPTMFPWAGDSGEGGFEGGSGGGSPCPGGTPMKQCTSDVCATTSCPEGQSCHTSPCNCTAICSALGIKYKGPVNLGGAKAGVARAGQKWIKGLKTRKCAQGKAVQPKTCKGDPCDDKKCNEKTQTCVREFCGGCHAVCVPKEPCSNNTNRRGCVSTANFCMAAKCGVNQTCMANQCSDCSARCFGPCGPGRYPSHTSAKCETCPRGFACSGSGSPDPNPTPCNSGFYAARQGAKKCRRCPRGQSTPKDNKGYSECK